MAVQAKICGLQDDAALHAAIEGGASMVGFVFFAPSKNSVAAETAARLAKQVPPHIIKVGLFVDAADAEFTAVLKQVPLDLLQLHGVETPERVAEIRQKTHLPVMKALRLKTPDQFKNIAAYDAVADRLLFDSRIGNESSGGPLDWVLLAEGLKTHPVRKPWMLAGGLNARNVAEAVNASGARAVDISSGVESTPHQKCPEKIREFLAIVARL